jgi:23S rRNA (cytosine1962-C5)-methyltransferase
VTVDGNIILKSGRERPVKQHHPWIFSGAIDYNRSKLGEIPDGGIVDVRDDGGGFQARGYYNPRSQIRVRIQTWDQNDAIGPAWWRVTMAQAIARRELLRQSKETTAYRLINAENDGLPGLIVDRYGDYLVMQALTLGVDVRKDVIVQALADLAEPKGIFERSDASVRELEGLDNAVGVLWGEEPPNPLTVKENGMTFLVDLHEGHKTGFYLDQRDARHWVRHHPAVAGQAVLNCFSYTGSFGVAAALNGASRLVNVDTSQPALDLAAQNMAANSVNDIDTEYITADVFDFLRDLRDEGERFDLIILDPPKFATSKSQVERATRGYKDINLTAFQLLEPGGLLLTYSCSSHVDADLFQKVVFGASIDAGVHAQIVDWFAQPADHPVLLTFPEGRYLSGLACEVTAG